MSKRTWAIQTLYNVIEYGGVRFLDAVTTLILIRVLSLNEFGIFSFYQSVVSIILLFLPQPIMVLFRRYGELKKNNELEKALYSYKAFEYVKLGIILIVSVFLALDKTNELFIVKWMLVILAFSLPVSQSVFNNAREPLRFELKQKTVTYFSLIQRIITISFLFFVFYYFKQEENSQKKIVILVLGMLFIYFIFYFVWYGLLKNYIKLKYYNFLLAIKDSLKTIKKEVLFLHLNGVLFSVVQTIDVLCLKQASISFDEIGRYSLALKTANFFQVISYAVVATFSVYLGRKSHDSKVSDEIKKTKILSFYNMGFAFLLFIFSFFVAEPVLSFIGKGKITGVELMVTKSYFIYLVAGVLALSATHPISTLLQARYDLKEALKKIYIPWLVLSYLIYRLASIHSVLRVAQLNIVVYFIYFILVYRIYKLMKLESQNHEN